jgi:hypothetical protein
MKALRASDRNAISEYFMKLSASVRQSKSACPRFDVEGHRCAALCAMVGASADSLTYCSGCAQFRRSKPAQTRFQLILPQVVYRLAAFRDSSIICGASSALSSRLTLAESLFHGFTGESVPVISFMDSTLILRVTPSPGILKRSKDSRALNSVFIQAIRQLACFCGIAQPSLTSG